MWLETGSKRMGYNEGTAQRIRDVLGNAPGLRERRMFGGISFMLDGNMCCGVVENDLVLRVGRDRYEECLREPHVRPMDFTGRPLTGFIYVSPGGFTSETELEQWIHRSVSFVRTLPSKPSAVDKR
jgi:TfoX/Sxy family transcriptional regulator of competence genes